MDPAAVNAIYKSVHSKQYAQGTRKHKKKKSSSKGQKQSKTRNYYVPKFTNRRSKILSWNQMNALHSTNPGTHVITPDMVDSIHRPSIRKMESLLSRAMTPIATTSTSIPASLSGHPLSTPFASARTTTAGDSSLVAELRARLAETVKNNHELQRLLSNSVHQTVPTDLDIQEHIFRNVRPNDDDMVKHLIEIIDNTNSASDDHIQAFKRLSDILLKDGQNVPYVQLFHMLTSKYPTQASRLIQHLGDHEEFDRVLQEKDDLLRELQETVLANQGPEDNHQIAEQTLNDLRKKLYETETKLQDALNRSTPKEEEYEATIAKLHDKLQRQQTARNRSGSVKDTRVKELKQELTNAEDQLTQLRKTISESKAEIARLTSEYQNATEEVNKLNELLTQNRITSEEYDQQIQSLKQDYNESQDKLTEEITKLHKISATNQSVFETLIDRMGDRKHNIEFVEKLVGMGDLYKGENASEFNELLHGILYDYLHGDIRMMGALLDQLDSLKLDPNTDKYLRENIVNVINKLTNKFETYKEELNDYINAEDPFHSSTNSPLPTFQPMVQETDSPKTPETFSPLQTRLQRQVQGEQNVQHSEPSSPSTISNTPEQSTPQRGSPLASNTVSQQPHESPRMELDSADRTIDHEQHEKEKEATMQALPAQKDVHVTHKDAGTQPYPERPRRGPKPFETFEQEQNRKFYANQPEKKTR